MDCRVYHSVMDRTGELTCSNSLLNRLHANAVWSMRSNFVSIPTDCPQRDERMGWTGDICLFAPTATYLYDVHGFLKSWLKDVRAGAPCRSTCHSFRSACGHTLNPSPHGATPPWKCHGRSTWKAAIHKCSLTPMT